MGCVLCRVIYGRLSVFIFGVVSVRMASYTATFGAGVGRVSANIVFLDDVLAWSFFKGKSKASYECNVQLQRVAYTHVNDNYHTPSSILYTYFT